MRFSLVEKTHLDKKVAVRDVIKHLTPIRDGEISPKDPLHRARKLNPLNLKRIKSTPHDGGSSSQLGRQVNIGVSQEENWQILQMYRIRAHAMGKAFADNDHSMRGNRQRAIWASRPRQGHKFAGSRYFSNISRRLQIYCSRRRNNNDACRKVYWQCCSRNIGIRHRKEY